MLRTGSARRLEALLVHRPSHADWTLPKGKAEPGEADDLCAVREVAEETGLRCLLGPELRASRYRDRRGRDKLVRYWAMTVRDGEFAPNAEVDQVRWLPIAEAAAQVSYAGDRSVLASLPAALRGLVFLVRHASAGDRARWLRDDRERPLDDEGRRQAVALARPLGGYPLVRLVSSPYDRCLQTLEPLSSALARPVEQAPALAEGRSLDGVRSLVARLGAGPVVLCTHGDVMEALLGPDAPCAKGATWLLAGVGGALRPVRYWPPAA